MSNNTFRVAGVTMNNDKGENIQNLLKKITNGYKKNDYIESWDGSTKREMLEYGEESSEFEGQTLSGIVRLDPEPTNEYDPNAIKVILKDVNSVEHHVGYIKRDETNKAKELLSDTIAVSFSGGKQRFIDYDIETDKDIIKESEITRGLVLSQIVEKSKPVPESKPEPEPQIIESIPLTKEEKKRIKGEKWVKRSEAMINTGQGMQKSGGKMMGCGCLLTILITIPIIVIIIFLFI